MSAVIYLRVGNKDQLDGSLSNQGKNLKAYCKSKNWTVANIYSDNGYKGTSIDRLSRNINDGFNSNSFIGGLKC